MINNLRRKIRKYFFPDKIVESVKDVDFEALKQLGYRVILLDIDNTLVAHGTSTADKSSLQIKTDLELLEIGRASCRERV